MSLYLVLILLLVTNYLSFSFVQVHRLVGLVVKASASGGEDPGSNPTGNGIFVGRVILVTKKLALQWQPCQVPGIILFIGSALGLVGQCTVTG